MDPLSSLLAEKGVLLADGAIGTTLFDMGLTSGDSPEFWNVDKPENIARLHRDFIEAGSDIILTNTFGGTRHRLMLHHAEDRVFELNEKGALIARRIADDAGRPVIVAGSVGPTGELLEPLGALTVEAATEAFVEQMRGLKEGGADVLWIETMSSPDEIAAAVAAARAMAMAYVVTASFDTAGKTMMGLAPGAMPGLFDKHDGGPLGFGANCGVGASDLLSSILDMTKADPEAIVIAKANCGVPEVRGDTIEYTGTPDLMAEYACLAADAGARIIGGCCGTTCTHLHAMRTALDAHVEMGLAPRPSIEEIIAITGPMKNVTATQNEEAPKRERRGRRRRA